jgi:cytochrome P450
MTSDYEGRTFEDLDLILALHILLVGGHETVSSGLSNAIYLLCTHPEQMAMLRQNPERIANAVEEVLRYATTPQCLFRTNTADVTIAGVDMPADSKIGIMYGAGNRDPEVFHRAEVFDVTRDTTELRRHLAFGFGVHYCVGATLGRLEMRIALQTLLDRLPDLRLDEDRPPVRGDSLILWRYAQLPVKWTVPADASVNRAVSVPSSAMYGELTRP